VTSESPKLLPASNGLVVVDSLEVPAKISVVSDSTEVVLPEVRIQSSEASEVVEIRENENSNQDPITFISQFVHHYLTPVILENQSAREEIQSLREDLTKLRESKKKPKRVSTVGGNILTSEFFAKEINKNKRRKLEGQIKEMEKALAESHIKLRGMETLGEKEQREQNLTAIETYQAPNYSEGDTIIYRMPEAPLVKIGKIVRFEKTDEVEFVYLIDFNKQIAKVKDTFRVKYLLPKVEPEPHPVLRTALLDSIKLNQSGMIPLASPKTKFYESLGLMKVD